MGVYKANLHTHSTNSDAEIPMADMVEAYALRATTFSP